MEKGCVLYEVEAAASYTIYMNTRRNCVMRKEVRKTRKVWGRDICRILHLKEEKIPPLARQL